VNLTTRQKADAALAIACPVHGKPAGEPCTLPRGALAGSCMERRRTALEPKRRPGRNRREVSHG
jgi:hypothetical protein